jgi:hypothetical protein
MAADSVQKMQLNMRYTIDISNHYQRCSLAAGNGKLKYMLLAVLSMCRVVAFEEGRD